MRKSPSPCCELLADLQTRSVAKPVACRLCDGLWCALLCCPAGCLIRRLLPALRAKAGQGKVVASLDVDHAGVRVAAGSRDYSVRLFDFNGMKSDLKGFRRCEPSDGHPVHAVSWSPTGAQGKRAAPARRSCIARP